MYHIQKTFYLINFLVQNLIISLKKRKTGILVDFHFYMPFSTKDDFASEYE